MGALAGCRRGGLPLTHEGMWEYERGAKGEAVNSSGGNRHGDNRLGCPRHSLMNLLAAVGGGAGHNQGIDACLWLHAMRRLLFPLLLLGACPPSRPQAVALRRSRRGAAGRYSLLSPHTQRALPPGSAWCCVDPCRGRCHYFLLPLGQELPHDGHGRIRG